MVADAATRAFWDRPDIASETMRLLVSPGIPGKTIPSS
ncbi:hypothetical protein KKY_2839 [Pelagibacterium halotolerans B2]|uniref:Uncharacterized protein n=1 Tax=Pelagibacterium halotolerans (strain DSM 22347 / JCM 15775 / CGMCC 1.7692 / B2) TaxID=1082931 RepID=G4RDQ9_PELHB|nr:hypothetical protein KKY_2839 [Pelagibacterium halotolerans B2]